MSSVLTAAAIALALVVLCLAVPIEVSFDVQRGETSRTDIALAWLFGTIKMPLRARGSKTGREGVDAKTRQKNKRRRRKAIALVRNADFRRRFLSLIQRLLRCMRVKSLKARVRLGLDDPADTGRLWGVLGPLAAIFATFRKAHISIEPEFTAEVFTLQGSGTVRVVPLQVLAIGALFLLSPQVIRALAFQS